MDFPHQSCHRRPAQFSRYSCPQIQVNVRDKEVSTRFNKSSEPAEKSWKEGGDVPNLSGLTYVGSQSSPKNSKHRASHQFANYFFSFRGLEYLRLVASEHGSARTLS